MGVDLNRNFDIKWSEVATSTYSYFLLPDVLPLSLVFVPLSMKMGSSSDACSETYHGTSVESESETQAIVSFLKQNRPFMGAIDFHSFSQAIVYPYG